MDKILPHKSLPTNAKKVFQGEIFSVWQWPQKLYDGSIKTFELLERPDTAYLLPVLPDGKILLVDDEQPHRSPVLTIPRGMVESNELPEAGAVRECLEETGYRSETVINWFSYRAYLKNIWTIHFFIGRNTTKVAEPAEEPGERITLHPVSFEEFIHLGGSGQLQDLKLQTIILEAQLDTAKMDRLKQLLYG